MRGNTSSNVLCILFVGLIAVSAFFFLVPYESEITILEGTEFGILDHLTAPYHAYFPMRSHDQSIEIFLSCTEGSLDLVLLKSTEWGAWYNEENYTAYYEATNVTFVMATIQIEPPYIGSIDIIMQTNYGDVEMSVSIVSRSMEYNHTAGITVLLAAIPIALAWICYMNRMPKNL